MFDRCRRCLGLGYKGREDRGEWRIRNCPRCDGRGVDPSPETLPENRGLVMWGRHPAHGPVLLKLEPWSNAGAKRRRREGWTVHAYRPGEDPAEWRKEVEGASA